MPKQNPHLGTVQANTLRVIGQRIRARRKQLGVSATAAAEAAGMSRVTLHRIERGEPAVTMGAYVGAISVLGLELDLADPRIRNRQKKNPFKIPKKIRLSDYPQLKQLAWQLKGNKEITVEEAIDLYERNWRHVQLHKMEPHEKNFVEALLLAFGRERLLV